MNLYKTKIIYIVIGDNDNLIKNVFFFNKFRYLLNLR